MSECRLKVTPINAPPLPMVTGVAWNPSVQMSAFELLQGPYLVSTGGGADPILPANPRRLCWYAELLDGVLDFSAGPGDGGALTQGLLLETSLLPRCTGMEMPGIVQYSWRGRWTTGTMIRIWEYLALH